MIAVVLGNDHTNSVGVIQTLGLAGYDVYAFVWGRNNGFVKSCHFTKGIVSGKNAEVCVLKLKESFPQEKGPIPVIACCDSAALSLELHKDELKNKFAFEYVKGKFSLSELSEKTLQVELASNAGFRVPRSCVMTDLETLPTDVNYPCLIKPLVSCLGAKSDIRICKNEVELLNNLASLRFTKKILLQQYIERDYEISVLGCGLSNGGCIIPCVEYKLTLYPKKVGLECTAIIQPLNDKTIIEPITRLIEAIGYVGVFSVEMMHSKEDDNFYFTEINLRNDGANSFIRKAGVDLINCHVSDLLGKNISYNNPSQLGYYIWEMHHFQSLLSKDISVRQWLSDIRKSKGFLLSCNNDMKPFYKQFTNLFKQRLGLLKYEDY